MIHKIVAHFNQSISKGDPVEVLRTFFASLEGIEPTPSTGPIFTRRQLSQAGKLKTFLFMEEKNSILRRETIQQIKLQFNEISKFPYIGKFAIKIILLLPQV